jgi:hypothetical protein
MLLGLYHSFYLSLNACFTYLNRGTSPDSWENELTTIQSAFLDILRMDWNFFDTKTNIAQRDMSLNLFQREWKDGGLRLKPKPKGEMDSPLLAGMMSLVHSINSPSKPISRESLVHVKIDPYTTMRRPKSATIRHHIKRVMVKVSMSLNFCNIGPTSSYRIVH